jgi:hypothetical protein
MAKCQFLGEDTLPFGGWLAKEFPDPLPDDTVHIVVRAPLLGECASHSTRVVLMSCPCQSACLVTLPMYFQPGHCDFLSIPEVIRPRSSNKSNSFKSRPNSNLAAYALNHAIIPPFTAISALLLHRVRWSTLSPCSDSRAYRPPH